MTRLVRLDPRAWREPYQTEFLALLAAPYAIAWVLLGLRMAIRDAPTIVDPPLHPIQPEVRPA